VRMSNVSMRTLFTLWSTALSGSWLPTFGVNFFSSFLDKNERSLSGHPTRTLLQFHLSSIVMALPPEPAVLVGHSCLLWPFFPTYSIQVTSHISAHFYAKEDGSSVILQNIATSLPHYIVC
jgi:hypothetical protein